MSKSRLSKFFTDRDASIFRLRAIILCVLLSSAYCILFLFYREITDICRFFLNDSLATAIRKADFGSFFDAQLSLLGTAFTTLAIVATFLEQRYLGASYKYWLFKNSPDWFTPQENILLMSVNLIGSFLCVVTGEYKLLALFSFSLSWYLFLYLIYQIHIYVIKVSHVLHKFRDQLIQKRKHGKWDANCDRIYKKLIAMREGDANKSYLMEEVEIILQMMLIYQANPDHDCDFGKTHNLKKVIIALFENSSSNLNTIIIAPESVNTDRAKQIITMGNALFSSDDRRFTYQKKQSPLDNLDEALNLWFPASNSNYRENEAIKDDQ